MFYEQLAKYYDVVFPSEPGKIAFLDREFKTRGAGRILDLACGTGTYALELARLGYEAYGTDIEPQMVELAKEKAATHKVAVNFSVGDMREPQSLGLTFDGLLCIGNSLAHLLDEGDLDKALAAMRSVLRDKGVAVLQIVNFDRILSLGDTDLPLIERKGLRFLRTYRPQGSEKLVFDSVLEVTAENGVSQRFKNSVELRPIRRADLEDAVHRAGFSAVKTFGDFKYGNYSHGSQALVMLAE
ncbi:MAG: class I SAM-dependent methyltransferase [Dethiobacter sp.]|nr:class I SAM-dependent methyltransferase [Dethiobacter sp.]